MTATGSPPVMYHYVRDVAGSEFPALKAARDCPFRPVAGWTCQQRVAAEEELKIDCRANGSGAIRLERDVI